MAKVAVIVDKNFEDLDLRTLVDGLRDRGHEVITVGPGAIGKSVVGRRHEVRVSLDVSTGDAEVNAFDGLIIPPGYTPDQLRAQENLLNLIRDVYAQGKPVAAVSPAGWLLLEPDPTHGKFLTSWPSVKRDLLNVGADWREVDLVEHDNVLYSRNPDDLDAFIRAFDEALSGGPKGRPEPAWRSDEELSPLERVYGPAPSEPGHAVD